MSQTPGDPPVDPSGEDAAAEETPAGAVDVAALEAERDFLLRSLDDLETERAAGNLDVEQYREFHDDYTARAAAVLRSLKGGIDVRPAPPPTSRRRKVIAIAAIVVFSLTAGALLAAALGDRLPGQTASGNQQASSKDGLLGQTSSGNQQASPKDRLDILRQQVEDKPDDSEAHVRLAEGLLSAGEVAEAVKEFDKAAMLDPTNARALAYGGWVVFLAARAAPESAAELIDGAMRRLDAAVAANADYPDAHFFRGMILFRGKNDPAGAVPEFERYLALVPDGPQSKEVANLAELARQGTNK